MNRRTPNRNGYAVRGFRKQKSGLRQDVLDRKDGRPTWLRVTLLKLVNGALGQSHACAEFGLIPSENRPRNTHLCGK